MISVLLLLLLPVPNSLRIDFGSMECKYNAICTSSSLFFTLRQCSMQYAYDISDSHAVFESTTHMRLIFCGIFCFGGHFSHALIIQTEYCIGLICSEEPISKSKRVQVVLKEIRARAGNKTVKLEDGSEVIVPAEVLSTWKVRISVCPFSVFDLSFISVPSTLCRCTLFLAIPFPLPLDWPPLPLDMLAWCIPWPMSLL